jgi:hypothetical protein
MQLWIEDIEEAVELTRTRAGQKISVVDKEVTV